MGQRLTNIIRRTDESVQEVAIANSNAYKWPPKAGNYFGSHFIMGGERFDSQQPEAFLFGENSDLNFLGSRPMPFPYPAPQLNEPTRTLRSLVNIRKDTVRLVKYEVDERAETAGAAGDAGDEARSVEDVGAGSDTKGKPERKVDSAPSPESSVKDVDVEAGDTTPPQDHSQYSIEFTFDSDATCNITVMYFAKEDVVNGVAVYTPREVTMNSETFTYKRGANQVFTQSNHLIKPSDFTSDEWTYSVDKDKEEIPIVIHCTVEKEPDHTGHSHVTFCVLEQLNDGYHLKVIKQKQCVDGLLYILQEFYGIENKEDDHAKPADEEDFEDNTAECVICMSDIRDTLILPCRHLCLCNGCADSLRYQANNCPICRAPFRALLQIRAIRKKGSKPDSDTATNGSDDDDELAVSQQGVPQGYEAISLIEALNGPCIYNNKPADPKMQKVLSHGSLRRSKKSKKKDGKGSKLTLKDKNKDKDDIANEEKAREAEAKDKENENNETKVTEKDADSTTVQTREAEESVEGAEDQTSRPTKDTAGEGTTQTRPEKTVDKVDCTEESTSKDAQSCENVVSGAASECDDTESDMLASSLASQTTTLPGTPDHVIEDDEMMAEHSL